MNTIQTPARNGRRGIATLWIIVAMPTIMVLFVMLVDIGNVWLAKIELKNATDAAALSGVKTWGEGSSTAQARLDANDAFSTNTILGNTSTLNTTEGGCANGNVNLNGELLLGSTTDAGGVITFNCDGTPACVFGAISVSFEVNTLPIAPDTANEDTLTRRYSYRITNFAGPAGSTLNAITINLANMTVDNDDGNGTVVDNGFFDFREQPPTADNQTGADFAPAVAPEVLALGDTFLSSSPTGVVATPNATLNSTPTALTVNFAGFGPGETINFAADTDRVGPDNGTQGDDVADFGGHFGTNYVDSTRSTVQGAQVTVFISGQSFSGTLVADTTDANTLEHRSSVTINGVLTGGDAFAVRARKTIQISSLADNLFGITLNPYNVTTESYARFVCTNGPPQLIRVDTLQCTCPP